MHRFDQAQRDIVLLGKNGKKSVKIGGFFVVIEVFYHDYSYELTIEK